MQKASLIIVFALSTIAITGLVQSVNAQMANEETFKEVVEENKELTEELKEYLDCEYVPEDRCMIMFTGSGYAIVSSRDQGLEDETIYDFMGINHAQSLVNAQKMLDKSD